MIRTRRKNDSGQQCGTPDHDFGDGGKDAKLLLRRQEEILRLLGLTAALTLALLGWLALQSSSTGPVFRQGIECRYDGHCPTGMTCAVPSSGEATKLPGICEEFPIIVGEKPSDACVDACRNELQMDTHFFHEQWPEVIESHTTMSAGRPRGCALSYKHTPDNVEYAKKIHAKDGGTPATDVPPCIHEWEKTRFRHILRVDPLAPAVKADDRWVAYCTAPCETNHDCATGRETNGARAFICQAGSCQRNEAFWEADLPEPDVPIIVTGLTRGYYSAVHNFIGSARYWSPKSKIVVYNLGGLSADQLASIQEEPNVVEIGWPNGIPEEYPQHVHIGKVYAWKPIIIRETLEKYGMILWMDTGSTFTGPITPATNILKRNGVFLAKGQDTDMKQKSCEKSYTWFNMTKSTAHVGPHFSGNLQAFLYPSRFYDSIVKRNDICARDKSCIHPDRCSLSNHRFDQTTLSLCAYDPKVWAPHHTEYLAGNKAQLNGHFHPNFRFSWTSRKAGNKYVGIRDNYLGIPMNETAAAKHRRP